jgi:uncharacterized Ntn-hydrolase superfamily protein
MIREWEETRMSKRSGVILAVVAMAMMSLQARATFSISACDSSGACGVAVATNNLAVGASVPHARARVGAVASQFETNPEYGPRALAALADRATAAQALEEVLAADGNFEGQGTGYRQVAIVRFAGDTAIHNGEQARAAAWSGGLESPGVVIIGNGLAGGHVLVAMQSAFNSSTGALPGRLLAALEAGQRAGGQAIGAMSAALLVRTPDGGFADTDLRVDASGAPVRELRRLYDFTRAHQVMLRAEAAARVGRKSEAASAITEAVRLGGEWDRILRRAARLSMQLGEPERAREYLARFRAVNPAWARIEQRDEIYLERNRPGAP